MIILLDIGNTSATYGLYRGGRLRSVGYASYGDIPIKCKKWLRSGAKDKANHIVISSVVPKMTRLIAKKLRPVKGVKVWIVGQNLKVPLRHRYTKAKQLGIDRLVNIYGAWKMYTPPAVVIDFGTAVTLDYLSPKGIFEGGLIVPGPGIAFQALTSRAAQISGKLKLPHRAKSFLGHTTYECMQSGILEGYGSMMDELILRFKKRFGKKTRAIATGGFTAYLRPFTHRLDVVDENHSIKSLLALFKDHQKRSGTPYQS